jgi:hypothetical protein
MNSLENHHLEENISQTKSFEKSNSKNLIKITFFKSVLKKEKAEKEVLEKEITKLQNQTQEQNLFFEKQINILISTNEQLKHSLEERAIIISQQIIPRSIDGDSLSKNFSDRSSSSIIIFSLSPFDAELSSSKSKSKQI